MKIQTGNDENGFSMRFSPIGIFYSKVQFKIKEEVEKVDVDYQRTGSLQKN